jgi:hypothetical protein
LRNNIQCKRTAAAAATGVTSLTAARARQRLADDGCCTTNYTYRSLRTGNLIGKETLN